MKVAVIGYGRQGKKHVDFWKRKGVVLDIYTRTGSQGSQIYTPNVPFHIYKIIIVAVSPIVNQTRILQDILCAGYQEFLVIEKPITYSRDILETLVQRTKTIFFIDEIFLYPFGKFPIHISRIESIKTYSPYWDDHMNICQHAIGPWLSGHDFSDYIKGIIFIFSKLGSIEYQCIGEYGSVYIHFYQSQLYLLGHKVGFTFDFVYMNMIKSMENHSYHAQIRKNYSVFIESYFSNVKDLIKRNQKYLPYFSHLLQQYQ